VSKFKLLNHGNTETRRFFNNNSVFPCLRGWYFLKDIMPAFMYKLVILIEPQDHSAEFDRRWPEFLAAAERLPGLRREVTSHVDRVLSGAMSAHMMHELHFDSLKAAGAAMASPEGQAAGALLQEISGGKVTLMLADHSQDDLAHIRKHVPSPTSNVPPGNRA